MEDYNKRIKRALTFFDLSKVMQKEFIGDITSESFIKIPKYFSAPYKLGFNTLQSEKRSNATSEKLTETPSIVDLNLEEKHKKLEDIENLKKKYFCAYDEIFYNEIDEIISLNNFLYLMHSSIIKSAPFYLDNKNANETYGVMHDWYKVSEFYDVPTPDSFIDDDKEFIENYENDFEDFFSEEVERWVNYLLLYVPGFTLSLVMIYLEKFLIKVQKKCEHYKITKYEYIKPHKMSILDGRIKYLKESCELEFNFPPYLSKMIFYARITRNMFSHGDWNDIEKNFKELNASKIINAAFMMVYHISLAFKNKLDK